MTEINFTVPGTPVGKGRPRFVRATGRTYTPDRTLVYENWVRECWRNGNFPKLTGSVTARINAFFPIPKSVSKKKRAVMESEDVQYTGKPDTDNVAKCVLDSLNGMAFDDDSQVSFLIVTKSYGAAPRCEVALFGEEEGGQDG